ncbi:MAG: hypothetical protein IJC55_01510 [Clostridia bacterium]|nr:hypothetical protein [Clostridia bacterium]
MKKFIAICLSVCLLICCGVFAISASAASDSPTANVKVSAMIKDGNGAKAVKVTVIKGDTIEISAEGDGKFDGWSIYRVVPAASGKGAQVTPILAATKGTTTVKAIEGTDYDFISGSLTTKDAVLEIHTDLIICANYDGTTTTVPDFETGKSPQTSDLVVPAVILVMMAICAAGIVVARKAR